MKSRPIVFDGESVRAILAGQMVYNASYGNQLAASRLGVSTRRHPRRRFHFKAVSFYLGRVSRSGLRGRLGRYLAVFGVRSENLPPQVRTSDRRSQCGASRRLRAVQEIWPLVMAGVLSCWSLCVWRDRHRRSRDEAVGQDDSGGAQAQRESVQASGSLRGNGLRWRACERRNDEIRRQALRDRRAETPSNGQRVGPCEPYRVAASAQGSPAGRDGCPYHGDPGSRAALETSRWVDLGGA